MPPLFKAEAGACMTPVLKAEAKAEAKASASPLCKESCVRNTYVRSTYVVRTYVRIFRCAFVRTLIEVIKIKLRCLVLKPRLMFVVITKAAARM